MLASANRKLFTGHEYDANTGLYYAKARYYDPDQGRFLTQDSYLGQPGVPPSLHRYLYVASNPTRYVDPTGNFFQECEGVDCMLSSDELDYQISSGDFRSPGATGGMVAERAAEAFERRREVREWEAATERSRMTLEDRSGREQIATELPYLDRALTPEEVRAAEWNGVVDGGIDKVVGLAELSGGALPAGMVVGPALGRFTERVFGDFRPAPETNARAEYLRGRSRGAFHGATTAVELGSGMVAGPGTSLALGRVSGAVRSADELVEAADLGRAMTSGARATRGPPVTSNAALRPGAVLEDAWAGSAGAARARSVVAEAPVPASRTILGNEVGAPVVRQFEASADTTRVSPGYVSGFREILGKARAAKAGDVQALGEIQAAKVLRAEGRNVHFQTPTGRRGATTADFLVGGERGTGRGGEVFDVFTPRTRTPANVALGVASKNNQAPNIIVNIRNNPSVTIELLGGVEGLTDDVAQLIEPTGGTVNIRSIRIIK